MQLQPVRKGSERDQTPILTIMPGKGSLERFIADIMDKLRRKRGSSRVRRRFRFKTRLHGVGRWPYHCSRIPTLAAVSARSSCSPMSECAPSTCVLSRTGAIAARRREQVTNSGDPEAFAGWCYDPRCAKQLNDCFVSKTNKRGYFGRPEAVQGKDGCSLPELDNSFLLDILLDTHIYGRSSALHGEGM